MYLATLKITMDLEPEVPSQDRERVMRSLRDKVKQSYSQRVVVRNDDDVSLYIALFDDNQERAKSRIEDVLELVDTAGEARISLHQTQVFNWFDGQFLETKDNLERSGSDSRNQSKQDNRMIVYNDESDEDDLVRFDRRQMRIPTRK